VSGSFAASAATAPPTAGTRVQLIQVAAAANVAQGRELAKTLREAGFDAYWESVRAASGSEEVVRVRVAVDRASQSVDETMSALRKRGLDPMLVNP
jgi:cell division septation protein DedD